MHNVFMWATWAVAAFGVGGTVALVVALLTLGPAVVQAWLVPSLVRFLRCSACVAAVVFVLATVGAYWVGHHQAASECKAGELAASLRNQEFDLAEAQNAKAEAEKRAKEIEKSSAERATQDAEYIKSLEAKPACALDDGDIGGVPDHKSRPHFPRLTAPAK